MGDLFWGLPRIRATMYRDVEEHDAHAMGTEALPLRARQHSWDGESPCRPSSIHAFRSCSDPCGGRWVALVLTSAVAELSDWAFSPVGDLPYGYFTLCKTSFLLHGHASFPGVYRTKHRDSLQRGPPCCLH